MGTPGSLKWALLLAAVSFTPGAGADDPPELELLEFLSEWQDDDGTMLEPHMFDDESEIKLEEQTEQDDVPR